MSTRSTGAPGRARGATVPRCRRGVLGALAPLLLLPACADEVQAPPSLDEQLAQATPVAAEEERGPDDPGDDPSGQDAATADDAVARDDLLDRLDSACFDRAPEMARLDQAVVAETPTTTDDQGLPLDRLAPLLRRNHDIQREIATMFEEAAAQDPHFDEVDTILQDGVVMLDRLADAAEADDQEGFLDAVGPAFDMADRLVAAARDAGLQVCYVQMQTVVGDG